VGNIWEKFKGHIASKNVTWNMEEVGAYVKKCSTLWTPVCEHVKKLENEYCDRDAPVTMQPILS
jgi:hypothetical protein